MSEAVHEVIDALEVLVCGLDALGTIQLFNRPCERVTGLARTDAIGRSWLQLFAVGQRGELVQELWSQVAHDAPTGPYESLCRNGRNLRWQFSRPRGGPESVVLWAVGIDVTDEREALVRAREVERVVALGNMVSGLTHELRNPLNGALLQLAVAERTLARHDDAWAKPAAAAIAQAAGEVRRVAGILDDFLVFARPQPIHLERCDVRDIAARALERAIPRAAAAGVTIELEPCEEAQAQLDMSRVESAVYQLLANAIDAADSASERSVRARVVSSGNSVTIEIEDRGRGVPPGTQLFEPFFTTKKGGTGLGLSIVQRVATDHGGTITHERIDGATVFRLELPIIGGGTN